MLSSPQPARALLTNGETLPRFEELYATARGRAIVHVDFKVDVIERTADWIHRHGAFDKPLSLMRRLDG